MAKEYLSLSPAELAPIAIESEGEVFDNNEHEFINQKENHSMVETRMNDARPIVKVMVFSDCEHALDKIERIINRDMGSHLVFCRKGNGCVCAQIYAMQDFSVKECMCLYYTHLRMSICHRTEIWVSTEGGIA